MEEAGSISPVLINQLEVFKAQNAFTEKENRVIYLPFFPHRSNRGCSQGCSKKQANLKELYTSKTTLAQKIVLTPLNNEFILKKLYSTSFMQNNPP